MKMLGTQEESRNTQEIQHATVGGWEALGCGGRLGAALGGQHKAPALPAIYYLLGKTLIL